MTVVFTCYIKIAAVSKWPFNHLKNTSTGILSNRKGFFSGYSGFLHDITEILLKVAFNTIKPNQTERNVCVGNKPLLYILQITVNPYFNSRN